MASIRLTDNQKSVIKQSGLKTSDFVRRAVDHYILQMQNPYDDLVLIELQSWIDSKRALKSKICNTSVLQSDVSVTQNNTNVLETSTDVTESNTNVSDCNTNSETAQKNPTLSVIKDRIKTELPMLQRILNNPENCDTIPNDTLKMLSKKYDISKNTIEGWIVENKMWIKEGKFADED